MFLSHFTWTEIELPRILTLISTVFFTLKITINSKNGIVVDVVVIAVVVVVGGGGGDGGGFGGNGDNN